MRAAFVKIWGETAGAISWDPSTNVVSFEYDSDFRMKGVELSPLKMPATGQVIYSFPELGTTRAESLSTFKGLPGMLADSLPDRYGSELLKLWLAQRGRPENSMNPVETLCFIGKRGMGALEFEPANSKYRNEAFDIDVEELTAIAAHLLKQKSSFLTNLEGDKKQAVLDVFHVGTSAGGARPKSVIAFNENTGQVKSGQTDAPEGFEHWLLKFDGIDQHALGPTKGYGRVEMAYYNMASACGIDMMPSRLLYENDRAHFMTKRFDREGATQKHHVQTLCAMSHMDYNQTRSFSYEQLFQVMRELRLPFSCAQQMFRRMVFNVLARNCDDHTKNFAFRIKENGRWELAPAYDICFSYSPQNEWVKDHALSVNRKRINIGKQDLIAVAKSIGYKRPVDTIDQIYETISQWSKYADQVKISPAHRDRIQAALPRW